MSKINDLMKQYCPDGVEWKELKQLCKINRGRVMSKDYLQENKGIYPVYSSQTINDGILGRISSYDYDGEYLTWTTDGANAGSVFYRNGKFSITNICGLLTVISNQILIKFLYYFLDYTLKNFVNKGMGNPKLMSNVVEKLQIPLPPLPVQQEIVNILDKFTELEAELEAELEGRKKQYEHYRNTLLTFGDDVEWKELGEIGKICMCKRIMKHETNSSSGIPFYKIGTFGKKANAYISNELFQEYKKKYSFPKTGDILISASGTIGKTVVYDGKDAYFQDSNIVWIDNNEKLLYNKFLLYLYSKIDWKTEGGTIKRLYNSNIASVKIPVPPLSVQEKIVTILDKFDKLVNDIKEGLPAEIALRRKQYEFYRNKLLDFKDMEK